MKLELDRYEMKKDLKCGEILIKKHLLIDEIATIANNMVEEEDSFIREITKGILLVHFCTNIDVKTRLDENGEKVIVIDKDEYDLYNTNDILKTIEKTVDKRDLDLIQKFVDSKEGISTFLKGINEKIDEYSKEINLKDAVESLKGVMK